MWASEEKRLVTLAVAPRRVPGARARPQQLGYALVGGRLVAGNEKPTAFFDVRERRQAARLAAGAQRQAAGPHETAFRYAIEDGVGVFYWVDDDCAYALSGPFDRTQLLGIARVVYGQLAAAPKTPAAPAPKSIAEPPKT